MTTNSWAMLYGTVLIATIALVRGDSELHWVSARVGKDVSGGSLGFGVELRLEGRAEPLDFALALELPASGPLAALRVPTALFAFADEDKPIRASLPPRLMPRKPVFLWEFTDTTEVWRTTEGQLVRRFRSEDSGMVRVLLYDGESGALEAGVAWSAVAVGLWLCRVFAGPGALGSHALSGTPSSRCNAAQPKQAPRQPHCTSIHADKGQPTVLANPAISVMPVMAPRAPLPYSRTSVAKAAS